MYQQGARLNRSIKFPGGRKSRVSTLLRIYHDRNPTFGNKKQDDNVISESDTDENVDYLSSSSELSSEESEHSYISDEEDLYR